jgi:hypothetical protein
MLRSFSLIALAVGGASATKSLRATGQWGSDLDAEAATVSAGSDKWDTEDEADLDKKLLKPVYTDGDFFQQYFTPAGGFKTPVGEQAACIVDKASHIMNFHFCHDNLARPFSKSYKQDCDAMFIKNTLKDINECCLGESHIPLWAQMHTCKHKVAPITAFMTKYLGSFDSCLAKGKAYQQAHPKAERDGRAFKNADCGKTKQVVPLAAKKLFKVATDLYVLGHKLDVTDHAKSFMRVCEPGLGSSNAKKLFPKKCRNMLAKMWTKVTKQSVKDDDWSQ